MDAAQPHDEAPPADAAAPAMRDLSPRAQRNWGRVALAWQTLGWVLLVLILLMVASQLSHGMAAAIVLVLVPAYLSAILVHESGHWIAARRCAMAVANVGIGPLELQPRRRGLRVRLRSRRGQQRDYGGWVLAYPDPRRDLRGDAIALAWGGCAANLAVAAVCAAVALLWQDAFGRTVALLLATMHGLVGALNLLPYPVGGHSPSDGLTLWRLRRNRYEDLPGASVKRFFGHLSMGLDPNDLPPELLRRMAAEDEPMPLLLDWLAFAIALDRNDEAAAGALRQRLRERVEACPQPLRESLADLLALCELHWAFHRALWHRGGAAAAELELLNPRARWLWPLPHLAPRVRALAEALRGDAARARHWLERSRRYVENDPTPGLAAYEAGLRERVAALIDTPPTTRSQTA